MIVCDLGARLGHFGEERGFPHVGEADQPDVRNGLQLQQNALFLRLFAGLGKVRRVAAAVGKARVALSPVSARQNGDLLPLVIEIGDDVFGLRIPDHRAEGDV